jgi:hypothetical protein
MNLDERERLLVCTALFEWIEKENLKPANERRECDALDISALVSREMPNLLKTAELQAELREQHKPKHRTS